MTVGGQSGVIGASNEDSNHSSSSQPTNSITGSTSISEGENSRNGTGEENSASDTQSLTADQSAQRLLEDNTQLIKTITDSQQSAKAQDVFPLYQALHRNLLQLAQLTEPGNLEIPHLLPAPDPNIFSATLKPPSATLMATVPPPQNYVPPNGPQPSMITSRGGKPANIVNPYQRRPPMDHPGGSTGGTPKMQAPPPPQHAEYPTTSGVSPNHHHQQHLMGGGSSRGGSSGKERKQQTGDGTKVQHHQHVAQPHHAAENAVVIPVPKPVPASTVLSSMELQPQPVKQESSGFQHPYHPPANSVTQPNVTVVPQATSSETTSMPPPPSQAMPTHTHGPNDNMASPRSVASDSQANTGHNAASAAPVSPAVTKFTAPAHVDPYQPLSAHTQSVLSNVSSASKTNASGHSFAASTAGGRPHLNTSPVDNPPLANPNPQNDVAPNVNVTDAIKRESVNKPQNHHGQMQPPNVPQHQMSTSIAHQMNPQYPGSQGGPTPQRPSMSAPPPPSSAKYGQQHGGVPPHSGASNPYYNPAMPNQQMSPGGSSGSYPGYSHGMSPQGPQYAVPISQRANPYAQQYPRYPGQPYPGMYGSGHSYPPAHYASPAHYPPPSQYPPGSQYSSQYGGPQHHMQNQQQLKMYHHAQGQATSMSGHQPSTMPNANVTVHPGSAGQPVPPASMMGPPGSSQYHGTHAYSQQQQQAPQQQQMSAQHNANVSMASYPPPQSSDPQNQGGYSMQSPQQGMYNRQQVQSQASVQQQGYSHQSMSVAPQTPTNGGATMSPSHGMPPPNSGMPLDGQQ